MTITRVNFADNPTAAFTNLDANDVDLDGRVTAAKTVADAANASASNALAKANAAIPKAGGTTTGAIISSVSAGQAFGTIGSVSSGGTVFSDYYQSTISAVSQNIWTRVQCVDVNGGVTYSRINTSHFDASNADFKFQHNGIAQATTWQSTSDLRIKRNLVPLTDALDKVDQLVGYEFYEKRIMSNTIDSDGNLIPAQYIGTCGLLASDVFKVLPAAIDNLGSGFDTDDQPIDNILGVNDAGLSALFAEAIKALKAQNADLIARVIALEAR